jgi:hypothetical protein
VTTPDPGDKLVFIYGRTLSPHSTAFLASSPAPSITEGLLVFVQLVIAAMTTEPGKKIKYEKNKKNVNRVGLWQTQPTQWTNPSKRSID